MLTFLLLAAIAVGLYRSSLAYKSITADPANALLSKKARITGALKFGFLTFKSFKPPVV